MLQVSESKLVGSVYKAKFECPQCHKVKLYKTSYGKEVSVCGDCMKAEYRNDKSYTTKLKDTHRNMIARCHNTDNGSYYKYGAKGVTVCDRWHNFDNFYDDNVEQFIEANKRIDGSISIDRIDPTKGYFPANIRWISLSENSSLAGYKKVRQYDSITGEFIKEYRSVKDAAEALGVKNDQQIMRAARGERRISNGFIWKYSDDIDENWLPPVNAKSSKSSRNNTYKMYDLKDNLEQEYSSMKELLKANPDLKRPGVSFAARGKTKSYKGHRFSSSAYNHKLF